LGVVGARTVHFPISCDQRPAHQQDLAFPNDLKQGPNDLNLDSNLCPLSACLRMLNVVSELGI
jgi:hypothetical protein